MSSHGLRKITANWFRLLVLGASLFVTLHSSSARIPGALPSGKPNPLYPDEAQITWFNGTMNARAADPAHFFVVEREEEEGPTM